MATSPEGPPPPAPEGQSQTPSGEAPEKTPGTPLEDVSHHTLSDPDREAAFRMGIKPIAGGSTDEPGGEEGQQPEGQPQGEESERTSWQDRFRGAFRRERGAFEPTEGDLTPEELAERRAAEQAEEQEAGAQAAEGIEAEGEDERVVGGEFREVEPAEGERAIVQAGAGGEGEGGEPPEIPPTTEAIPSPEEPRSPEWLTSLERGRVIVKEILRYETEMPYEERYNAENGPKLNQLYKDLEAYVEAVAAARNERDSWDPFIRDNDGRVIDLKPREQADQQLQPATPDTQAPPEDFTGIPRINEIPSLYDPATPSEQLPEIRDQLQRYLKEAKRLGLLEAVDNILGNLRGEIQGDIPFTQARAVIAQSFQEAAEVAETVFASRRGDPAVERLNGFWTVYLDSARRRFGLALAGADQPDYLEGEFRFDQEQEAVESKETYWRPAGSWPEYYEVTAVTSEQFVIAKDTFLQMIKGRGLGLAPDKLFAHLENFSKVLGREVVKQARAGNVTAEFAEELRQEFEGLSYIWGADYTSETYNPNSYNQFMMALALHEGPQRWVRLARSGQGDVGAFLWIFDYDRTLDLFYNSGGSRNQIGHNTVAQNYLQSEIRALLIKRGMGIRMKDYDSRGGNLTADQPQLRLELAQELAGIQSELRRGKKFDQLSEREQVVYNAFHANIGRIGIHQTEEEFKGLYEGFDDGDAHIVAFQRFGDLDQKQLPASLRTSVAIGKVQTLLVGHEGKDRAGLVKEIDRLIRGGQLTQLHKKFWEAAYDRAQTNFDVAYQMVGASGEKVKRGGGVFLVDRNRHIEAYNQFRDVTDDQLTEAQRNSKRMGRIMTELRTGAKKWNNLSEEDRQFYRSFPDKGKFVDAVPTYLGQKFVQFAVNRCKIQYADDPADVRKTRVDEVRAAAIREFHTHGFSAKLVLPKILFDTEGNVIGTDGDNMEPVDFQTAVKSIYSRWTSHTYWGYQQENRHMLLDPRIFAAARRIRARLSRPDQEDPLATNLLVLDPTLRQVARQSEDQMPEGQSAMQAEIMLMENAVEVSYQEHYEIERQLYSQFLPDDGNPLRMRVGYNREDFGGQSRFIIAMKPYIAAHPKRFARRFASEIARMPMEISSMPDIWGQEGVLGAIEMFADPIGDMDMAAQKVASQFAITKFVDQMRYGWMLFGALVGYVDSEKGIDMEGLYEKPTNNSDKLHQLQLELFKIRSENPNLEVEDKLMYAMIDSFGRLDTVLKLMRVMQSSVRNAQGHLLVEDKEVLVPDGNGGFKFNPEIALEKRFSMFTGTSRHSQKIFFDNFIKWLTTEDSGKGVETYPGEKWWYKLLLEKTPLDPTGEKTRADWIFDKLGR